MGIRGGFLVMTRGDVYCELCIYDKRSPYHYACDDSVEPRGACCCDKCYYGKDKLALEILRLKDLVGEV